MSNSELKRVACNFQKELDGIKEKRIKEKIDDRKATNAELTAMIPKHKYWKSMKDDLIGFVFNRKNKKGLATLGLISFTVMSFMVLVVLGIIFFIYSTISTSLAIDVSLGQVNLANITAQTLTPINTAMLANADLISYMMIFGMILGMFANAYFLRDRYHRLFIILDIIIMVMVYIIAVYIAYIYKLLITATTSFDIYITAMPKASSLMLNLPIIVPIVGVIMMILSYAKLPRSRDEPILTGDEVVM